MCELAIVIAHWANGKRGFAFVIVFLSAVEYSPFIIWVGFIVLGALGVIYIQ